MRIATDGVTRRGRAFTFRFNGAEIEAWPGETIAAALLSAGVTALRRTRADEPRGIFCGMGVCGECSVLVDGVQRRSCLQYAQPGQEVAQMPPLATPAAVEAIQAGGPLADPDVLVVGAGPAGLSAAQVAARAGCTVLVADERPKAGGQYFKQPADGFTVNPIAVDAQFAEGAALTAATRAAGAEILGGATVWAASDDGSVEVAIGGVTRTLRPKRLILAPGAFERPHPVPGWTLPGVMTTGAAQTLLRAYQTAPGRRVLVAGNGPLNLQVARELVRAGVEVVALAEQAAQPGPAHAIDAARMMFAAPSLVADGVGHLLGLRKAGVPTYHRHVVVRAEGGTRVRRAVIARIDGAGRVVPDSEIAFEVDAVCLGYGFLPQSELARAAGCSHEVRESAGGLFVVRDDEGRSSRLEVFVVGDAGGLGGARIAMAQGALAGAAAARDLGRVVPEDATLSKARSLLMRHRRFQGALWRLYCAPALRLETPPETLLCRCEEVSFGTIQALIADGASSLGAIKKLCRAGMGRCQGRYCGALLAEKVAVAPDAYFAPRTPFKPVTVAQLAVRQD